MAPMIKMRLFVTNPGVLCLLFLSFCNAITKCDKTSLCSCETEDGLIDISPLSQSSPREIVGNPGSTDKFLWNPCVNFDYNTLKGVGAVQMQNDQLFTEIGTNRDDLVTTFPDLSSGNAIFMMSSTTGTNMAKVMCVCQKEASSAKIVFSQQSGYYPPAAIFDFTLTAPHCCPGYRPSPSDSGSGLSVGSIVLIMFVALLSIYLIGGICFQGSIKKANGFERIPNFSLWKKLPGVIKDGIKFTFTCGKRSITYESI